ncbi:uncharacterized protein BJ171DRAFT_132850 [Polychytrium aggregatum]|uniref:uncharacterized protein n=1 Tax=Polychytrium aggregatum TaxID=110093 RepID=UPI0022FEB2B6|nr:uncharacterized protein BJ171DRAFT_132850 [Polychytrium aggregatum]KAI9203779.1 hypothetical protein BJ171DRAFT_132850 [Polychytrium aggregatum]
MQRSHTESGSWLALVLVSWSLSSWLKAALLKRDIDPVTQTGLFGGALADEALPRMPRFDRRQRWSRWAATWIDLLRSTRATSQEQRLVFGYYLAVAHMALSVANVELPHKTNAPAVRSASGRLLWLYAICGSLVPALLDEAVGLLLSILWSPRIHSVKGIPMTAPCLQQNGGKDRRPRSSSCPVSGAVLASRIPCPVRPRRAVCRSGSPLAERTPLPKESPKCSEWSKRTVRPSPPRYPQQAHTTDRLARFEGLAAAPDQPIPQPPQPPPGPGYLHRTLLGLQPSTRQQPPSQRQDTPPKHADPNEPPPLDNSDCPICLGSSSCSVESLERFCKAARHVAHTECMMSWYSTQRDERCPVCRRDLAITAIDDRSWSLSQGRGRWWGLWTIVQARWDWSRFWTRLGTHYGVVLLVLLLSRLPRTATRTTTRKRRAAGHLLGG